jgi:hypothetical protein
MFKITQNSVHRFSLAEVLLIAAINQAEAKRKHSPAVGLSGFVGGGHDR